MLLYDNDSGAKPIRSAVKEARGNQLSGKEDFALVTKNLYVIATPLLNNEAESKIEDFFDKSIKKSIVDGKTFNDSNNYKSDHHYGKKIFAHRVIRPNADSIDFTGFHPLLTNLVAAMNFHYSSIAANLAQQQI